LICLPACLLAWQLLEQQRLLCLVYLHTFFERSPALACASPRFDGNSAGLAGGALFHNSTKPNAAHGLSISGSAFSNNVAYCLVRLAGLDQIGTKCPILHVK
jgi:hypothetical protein